MISSVQISEARPSAVERVEREVLRATAEQLEAHFLAEMLKAAGVYENQSAFSGGSGEEQFASFMRQAQAEKMVEAGGIGLAESFYQALVAKAEG